MKTQCVGVYVNSRLKQCRMSGDNSTPAVLTRFKKNWEELHRVDPVLYPLVLDVEEWKEQEQVFEYVDSLNTSDCDGDLQ